jgi:hypothetical protein
MSYQPGPPSAAEVDAIDVTDVTEVTGIDDGDVVYDGVDLDGTAAEATADRSGAAHVAAGLREHLDALGSLDLELTDHVGFYQHVHDELRTALSDIDDA